jgi:hypothetical protein
VRGFLARRTKSADMKYLLIASGLTAALVLAGCGKSSNVSTQSAVTGAPQGGGTVLVKAGTRFDGKLQQEIATNRSKDGDTFTIAEQDTLFYKDPALHGAVIDGHLENVSPAGLGKKPSLTLVFDDIKMPDGQSAPVQVKIVNMGAFDAKSHHWRTAGMVIGGAMAGHIAAGKHHGGLMGAAGGYLLSQQMKTNVDVKPGTMIELTFLNDAATGASPGGQ